MDTHNTYIQTLLGRYLDGQTSPEEQRLLAAWFAAHPEEPDAALFLAMLTPEDDEAALGRILTDDHTAAFDAEVASHRRVRTLYILRRMSVAAVFVFVAAVAWHVGRGTAEPPAPEAPLLAMEPALRSVPPATLPEPASQPAGTEVEKAVRPTVKRPVRHKEPAPPPAEEEETMSPAPEPLPAADAHPAAAAEEERPLMADLMEAKARMYAAEQVMEVRAGLQQQEHEAASLQEIADLADRIRVLENLRRQAALEQTKEKERQRMSITI